MNPALIEAGPTGGTAAGKGVPLRRATRPGESLLPAARRAKTSSPTRPVWWLWPHLLSLDAPLVAVVWQRWWAQTAGVRLPLSREIVLGLGVWMIYLADRLADSAGREHSREGAARHVFSGERRKVLRPLTLLVAVTLTTLTPRWLPAAEFRIGLGFLTLALGYFWMVHGWSGRGWAAYLPKEAAVGGMFAVGSAFFVACRSPHLFGTLWLDIGLFAAVCFLNCALITKWERHARDLREPSSLLNSFPGLSARLGTAGVLLATAALAAAGATASRGAVPVAASALLLTALDACENRLSTEALRVLADVVLLTPWLGWAYAAVAT